MMIITRYMFQRPILKCTHTVATCICSSRSLASLCYNGNGYSCNRISHYHHKPYKRTPSKSSCYGEKFVSTSGENQWTLDKASREITTGVIKNIIVLTGAGVSTASGLPDFRSDSNAIEPVWMVI